jgi:hypothetical protein
MHPSALGRQSRIVLSSLCNDVQGHFADHVFDVVVSSRSGWHRAVVLDALLRYQAQVFDS